MKKWNKRKREEAHIKKIIEEQNKEKEEHEKEMKREKGEQEYQKWLENSVMLMHKEQELRTMQRKMEAKEKKKVEHEKQLKKENAERHYQKWLKEKDEEKRLKAKEKKRESKERQRSIKTLNNVDNEVQKIIQEAIGEAPKRGKSSRSKTKKTQASPTKTDASKSTKKSRSKSNKYKKSPIDDGNYQNMIYEQLNKKDKKIKKESPMRYSEEYSDDQKNSSIDERMENLIESALRNGDLMTSKYN